MSSSVGAKSEIFAGRRLSSLWQQPEIHLAERDCKTRGEVMAADEVEEEVEEVFYCIEKHYRQWNVCEI